MTLAGPEPGCTAKGLETMWPLETERLVLRPFTSEDIERIYDLVYADSRVRVTWSGYTGTLAQFRERFVTDAVYHAEDGFGFLAVLMRDEDRLIGLMGFQRFDPGEDTSYMVFEDPADEMRNDPAIIEVELTYALGHAFWGHGYATEAARALISFGFRELGIERIVNNVMVHEKHRSLRLIERLGFRTTRNLTPNRMATGPFKGAPWVIGILERATWEATQGRPGQPQRTG